MKKGTSTQPIVIVLDSVDEIANDPDRNSLSWIPSTLPKNCKARSKLQSLLQFSPKLIRGTYRIVRSLSLMQMTWRTCQNSSSTWKRAVKLQDGCDIIFSRHFASNFNCVQFSICLQLYLPDACVLHQGWCQPWHRVQWPLPSLHCPQSKGDKHHILDHRAHRAGGRAGSRGRGCSGDHVSIMMLKVINNVLRQNKRRVNNFQNRLILNSLEKCSQPLFCNLVAAEVLKWKSFSNPR